MIKIEIYKKKTAEVIEVKDFSGDISFKVRYRK